MTTFVIVLLCSIVFGVAGIVVGYYRGIARGMRKRSRLQIINNFPAMRMREILN